MSCTKPMLGQSELVRDMEVQLLLNGEAINWERDANLMMHLSPKEFEALLAHPDFDAELFDKSVRNSEDYRIFERQYAERKAERIARNNFKTTIASASSECWVEPDDSYTEIPAWSLLPTRYPDENHYSQKIKLGWDFCLFGNSYSNVYVNEKGTISFEPRYFYYWSEPRELNDPLLNSDEWATEGTGYSHICAYWEQSDVYNTQSGKIFYKIYEDRAYFNFIDIGYYSGPSGSEKRNTFQIMITNGDAGYLGDNANVQFCYQEMEWAESLRTTNNGCDGEGRWYRGGGIVGVGTRENREHIQFGRFGNCSDYYGGAYGSAPDQVNGLNWLDFRELTLNACTSELDNRSPICSFPQPMDTVQVCLGNSIDYELIFMAPENNELITIAAPNLVPGLTIVSNVSEARGTARLKMSFEGTVEGFYEIEVKATDSGTPQKSTTRRIYIEVINQVLPKPTIEGIASVCVGSSSELCVTPDEFESYLWSDGTSESCMQANKSGLVEVACQKFGCTAIAQIDMSVGDYFVPERDPSVGNKVCLGDTLTLKTKENYSGYEWRANEQEPYIIYSDDLTSPTLKVGPGLYYVIVKDELGCEGQAAFRINPENVYLPEDKWSGAYCDGMETVTFTDGYSSPSTGSLLLELKSTQDGWLGDFIEVIITKQAGWSNRRLLTLATGVRAFESLPIAFGDSIKITYYGTHAAGNALNIRSCGVDVTGLGSLVDQEVYFMGASGCGVSEAAVQWSQVQGPCAGVFTNDKIFNTSFTPCEYGLYKLCIQENICNYDNCYLLEYTEAPDVAFTVSDDIKLCPAESVNMVADTTDIGKTAKLFWDVAGIETTGGTSRKVGPYNVCLDDMVSVTIENGCGSAIASVGLQTEKTPVPQLVEQVICPSETKELNPLAPQDQCAGYRYIWLLDGDTLEADTPSITPEEDGLYRVIVESNCFPAGVSAEASVLHIVPNTLTLPETVSECEQSSTQVCFDQALPVGFIAEWSNGQSGQCAEVTEDIQLTATVTDMGGCDEQSYSVDVTFNERPVINGQEASETTLCEDACIDLSIDADYVESYTWSLVCNANTYVLDETGPALKLCANDLDDNCKNGAFSVVVVASNICGQVEETFDITHQVCALGYHNVFTPNGDGMNDLFIISGAENFENLHLMVVNRWGDLVYENADYDNSWGGKDKNGNDLVEGTYYYTLSQNGVEIYSDSFIILRD